MSDFPQGAVGQATPEHQKQKSDPNTSIKTEYLSFPPPLQRSPLNTSTERGYVNQCCLKTHLCFFMEHYYQYLLFFPALGRQVGLTPPTQTISLAINCLTLRPESLPPPLPFLPTTNQDIVTLTRGRRKA